MSTAEGESNDFIKSRGSFAGDSLQTNDDSLVKKNKNTI